MAKYDQFVDVAPDASSLFESIRAHGYNLPTAIADLIDNSIFAGCKNVWIDFRWEGDDSWISVLDDGSGMTEKELTNAMRLGSSNPINKRDKSDLGRFGLGLKTASLSQARRLTVVARRNSGRSIARRWDLDHLAQTSNSGWQLLKEPHRGSRERAALLKDKGILQGTQVLLEKLDRVLSDKAGKQTEKDRQDHFLRQIDHTRKHLGMVFHRFISRTRKPVRISVNDKPVEPWDPFLADHKATQAFEPEQIKISNHAAVTVRGYVLPHRDRFESSQEHTLAAGPDGWNAQQGFYVYRADRMIISGSWLGLKWQQEEHFKLARIALDIPNSMDHEWNIDVKKSGAEPPAVLRARLVGIAKTVREEAKKVYSHRGKYGARKKRPQLVTQPWKTVKKSGEYSYKIDRKHPILEPLIKTCSASARKELDALLRLIEETVPVQRIWIDTAENQDGAASPFAGEKSASLKKLILICHTTLVKHRRMSSEKAWDHLAEFDGFQSKDALAIIGRLREEELN